MKQLKFCGFLLIFFSLTITGWGQEQQLIPVPFNRNIVGHESTYNQNESEPQTFLPMQQKRYSKGKALLLSLILPGAGEYYLGYRKTGIGFMLAEAGLWSGYFWTGKKYNNTVRDYKNYAYLYAGVDPNGHYSDEFWRAVGIYDNIFDNNEGQLIARNLNGVFDEELYFWDWVSDEYRFQYNRFRIKATDLKNFKNALTLTFFVNRILSMIDVIRLSKKLNREYTSLKIQYGKWPVSDGLSVQLTRTF